MNARIENKLGGRQAAAGLGSLMRPGVILSLVLISVFALGALITLSGFAGDLRKTSNGRAHALSESAIGYAGIVQLLRGNDMDVTLSRDELDNAPSDVFRIVTLSRAYQLPKREDLDSEIATLIVLPKWYVYPMERKQGWVKQAPAPVGPLIKVSTFTSRLEDYSKDLTVSQIRDDDGTLTYDMKANTSFMPTAQGFNIRYLQTLEGEFIDPVLTANDKVVLGRLKDTSIYILSEPDLLNTMGISQKSRARFAHDMIRALTNMELSKSNRVAFDLNIHGFARTQNLIKTLLTPPFLAATLCLLAAGGLVAWQAFARFGDPAAEARDYELGKYTLADNGARFIRIAGKETGMAGGYAKLTRRLAAQNFYMDRQSQSDIEDFFENREDKLGMGARWKELSSRLMAAQTKSEFLQVAKAIFKWRQEITHERK